MRTLILVLALIGTSGFAQNKVLEIKRASFTSSFGLSASDSSIYLNIAKNQYFNANPYDLWLYKLNLNLQIQDSLRLNQILGFTDSLNQWPRMQKIECFNNTIYCLIELQDLSLNQGACQSTRTYLLELDENLNYIKTFDFKEDTLTNTLFDFEIRDSVMILAGFKYNCSPSDYIPWLCRVNLNNNSRLEKVVYSDLEPSVLFFDNPTILEAGYLASAQYTQNRTVFFNDSLSIVKSGFAVDPNATVWNQRNMISQFEYLPISKDSTLAFATTLVREGSINSLDDYYTLGISLLDRNYNITKVDTFPLAAYDISTAYDIYSGPRPSRDPYDYRNLDSVLITISQHLINYDNFQSQDSNTIYLYNYNARKMEMNWIKTIKTNYTSSDHSVAALPGNRWVLSFNEYNWDRYQGPNLSVHLWLLDQNGSILN
ncbi:MAG: hypothetical protein ACPGVV_04315, partial [Croceimicrobium sp.]